MTYEVKEIQFKNNKGRFIPLSAAHCRTYPDLKTAWRDMQEKRAYPVARLSPSLKQEFSRFNDIAEQEKLKERLKHEAARGVAKGFRIPILSGIMGGVASGVISSKTLDRITNNRYELLLPRYNYRYEDEQGWLVVDFTYPSEEGIALDRGWEFI